MTIRTRFAPSPTGMLHIGGVRTALFCWLYARRHGGVFVLRIEDTDRERSTPEAVQAILEGMQWLGLDHDEGPFYQTARMDRYKEVIDQFLRDGKAYHCWCSKEELDEMRAGQMARKEKPRYDGRCRHRTTPVAGVNPVVRFRNPDHGQVIVNDIIHGPITFDSAELDDLIIARSDGTPTYNFCVVVDDWDMRISHVIRGDDHVNNTPRQINILQALGAELPVYGHVPMILGPDGDKLSKRHGAVSVTQYEDDGYLPEAMLNYLARLGWSHGDDELFSREQFIAWFDGKHLARSPAQWDPAKLNWVNAHHLKQRSDASLAQLVAAQLARRGIEAVADQRLERLCALFKDRCATTVELADWIGMYFVEVQPRAEDLATHVTDAVKPALVALRGRLSDTAWDKASIAAAIKSTLAEHGLKMPQLAHPVRVLVCGRSQTPSLDAVLELFAREQVLWRLRGV